MTETQPLISIIIPVYKVEPYLHQCLDSVLAQTYPHWEAICINDGSPDNCGAILDEYAAKDARFIVIHQENQGVSVARNRGLEVMQGKYLTFLDSDDWFSPNALECIIEAMETTNADYGRCSQTNHSEDNKKEIIHRGELFYTENTPYIFHPICVADRKNFATGVGGCILKSNKIKNKKLLFTPSAKIGEDLTFIIQYLQYSQNIAYIYTPIYHYRLTSGICHQLRSNTAIISDAQIKATFSLFEKIGTAYPYSYSQKYEIKGFKAIQLQSFLLQRVIFNNNILQGKTNHPLYVPFPWKYIFGIIPSSNYIDSLKLIIRFRFPFIDHTKNRILRFLKNNHPYEK